jgi:hypothetical protein
MQNAKIFMGVFSSIQNAKFFMGWVGVFLVFWLFFFGLLKPKSKIENEYLFAKKFAWCLVPFCKMVGQNSIFFLGKWETKHTLKRKDERIQTSPRLDLIDS